MSAGQVPEEAPLRLWHYQVWCGGCVALVFIAQLSQGILLTNVLACLLGVLGIVSRMKWGVFFLLIGVGFSQSYHFFVIERYRFALGAAGRNLDVQDFLLALGVLGYVVGQYRLLGLWHQVWPADPRQRRGPVRSWFGLFKRRPPIVQHQRTEEHLRPPELIAQAFIIPIVVMATMGLYALTRPVQGWLGWEAVGHLVIVFWILAALTWLVRQVMDLWRFYPLPRASARLFLYDQVWGQIRGELRRIERWRAWRRVDERLFGKRND